MSRGDDDDREYLLNDHVDRRRELTRSRTTVNRHDIIGGRGTAACAGAGRGTDSRARSGNHCQANHGAEGERAGAAPSSWNSHKGEPCNPKRQQPGGIERHRLLRGWHVRCCAGIGSNREAGTYRSRAYRYACRRERATPPTRQTRASGILFLNMLLAAIVGETRNSLWNATIVRRRRARRAFTPRAGRSS